ncbi:KIF6 [Symbiodinium sp. CCMP2592]|nr:KIF6 [Symbiodinium sp. CCMP2592]
MLGKPKARCFCIVHPESEQCPDISFSQTSVQMKLPGVGEEPPRGQQEELLRDFAFDRVFGPGGPGPGQARIFQEVAQPALQDAVERLESCCFVALGCSGHGKTFAVTGGPRRFEDRGLVPRAISCLFELLNAKTSREDFQVKVSFFELYRDSILDLLSKRDPVISRVGQSQKPRMPCPMELTATHTQVSCVSCISESEAYQRLFEGDARRHFERLPRNSETSRGHVFFQLHINKEGAEGAREAVLSFVDLATHSQCPRNQATESIERSLQELRQLARSICAGLPTEPEPGPLGSLLLPWLRPGGSSTPGNPLPGLVTLLPLKWQKQSNSEIYDFLQLARILHQAAKSRTPQPRNGAGPPIPRSPRSQEEASREAADTANSPSVDALTTWSPWSAVVVHSQKDRDVEATGEDEVGPRPVPVKSLPPSASGPRPVTSLAGLAGLAGLGLASIPTPLRNGSRRNEAEATAAARGCVGCPAELSALAASTASTPIRRPSTISFALPRRVSIASASQRTMPFNIGCEPAAHGSMSRSPSPWQSLGAPPLRPLRPRSCDAAARAPPGAVPVALAPGPPWGSTSAGRARVVERAWACGGCGGGAARTASPCACPAIGSRQLPPVQAAIQGVPAPLTYPCYSASVLSYSPVPMQRYPWSLGATGERSRSSSPCPRPGHGPASVPLHRTGSVPRVPPLVARSWIPTG